MDGAIEKKFTLGLVDRGCSRDCESKVFLVVARMQVGGNAYRSTGRLSPMSSRLVWAYQCAACDCGAEIGEHSPELLTVNGRSMMVEGRKELPAIDRASERGVIIFAPCSERTQEIARFLGFAERNSTSWGREKEGGV